MENRLEQAKAALQGDITFVAVLADGELVTSEKKGIAPMMALLKEDENSLKGAYVAEQGHRQSSSPADGKRRHCGSLW